MRVNFIYEWFRNLVAEDLSVSKEYSVVDPEAVGDNIRPIVLSMLPGEDDSKNIISLYWKPSHIKVYEKKVADDVEAQKLFASLDKDLSEVSELSKHGNPEQASKVMESLLNNYKSHTDALVDFTNPPFGKTGTEIEAENYLDWEISSDVKGSWLARQQGVKVIASSNHEVKNKVDELIRKHGNDFESMKKEATVVLQNVFFDTPEEAAEFQEKMKEKQGPDDMLPTDTPEDAPLGEETLSPPSMSYEDAEKQDAEDSKNLEKRIEKEVEEQIESTLDRKKATMFTDKDNDLIKAMRGVGRTWEEIKLYMVKTLKYEDDGVNSFVAQMQGEEEGVLHDELKPPTPPEELVSPETHDKLVEEVELPIEEVKLPIEKEEPLPEKKLEVEEIARVDDKEIRKVASDDPNKIIDAIKNGTDSYFGYGHFDTSNMADYSLMSDTINDMVKVYDIDEVTAGDIVQALTHDHRKFKKEVASSQSKVALNPLQEAPVSPDSPPSTMLQPSPTDDLFGVPEPKEEGMPTEQPVKSFSKGDNVYVISDFDDYAEEGFQGTIVSMPAESDTQSGQALATVKKKDGTVKEVPVYRLVKLAEMKNLKIQAAKNEEVIEMFVKDSFPKDKLSIWGTENLKIVKQLGGWALVNYRTPILYRSHEGQLYFNTQKYSVTTSRLQNVMKKYIGDAAIVTDEAGINKAINEATVLGDELTSIDSELITIRKKSLALQTKIAEEPEQAVPTKFKQFKISPPHTDKEKALPATPEIHEAYKKVEDTLDNLNTIKQMISQAEAKFKEEKRAIEEKGGKVLYDTQLKEYIERVAALVEATETQLVADGDVLLKLQQEEKTRAFHPDYKWKFEKAMQRLKKYEDAEDFLEKAVRGAQSLAEKETVRELIVFPKKMSKLDKEAKIFDTLKDIYENILNAFKALRSTVE